MFLRPPLKRGGRSRVRVIAAVAACVALGACSAASSPESGAEASGFASSAPPASAAAPAPADPDQPTSWGPTVGELDRARQLVAEWDARRLAGQVIVGRWQGTDPQQAASLVEELGLAGVQLTGSNIADEAQVRATTAAVAGAFARTGRDFPPVIGVDQEGGLVAHLAGVSTDLPPFSAAGAAVGAGEGGQVAVREAMAATGVELRGLGFTWVFAPVADVTIGAADPTIGSRSPSGDPEVAALAVTAAVEGFADAGVVSTIKHFPGHGGATEDSHQTLPVISAGLEQLWTRELVPFEAGIAAGAPAVMVGHLDVTALDPGVPSSLSAATYALLRDDLGFEGVTITDSLGMGGVMVTQSPAVAAVAAGADLLLMPADTRLAHQELTEAIEGGAVPVARAREAAAQVVAIQLWQQRVASQVPIPADISDVVADRVAQMLAYGQR